ncbi:MAG: hypothetical protein JWN80_1440 [Microbacteriaceae bacterium]|jgi:hypothetical protein|nr:hypothetical protein [Microbacteriaceae bacterium]
MATYQRDRFDSVPDDLLRTGAHRGPQKRGRGWITFAWAALATGILVVVGLLGLAIVNGKLANPFASSSVAASATPTPTPTMTPLLNPTIAITVLNGTATANLANSVGDNLVKQGWGGAAQGVGSRANASATDVKQTVVYYSDPANEGAARALVLSLKVGTIQLSDVYSQSPLTVVIGSDYKLP